MRITEDYSPAKDGKSLLIEFSGVEITKHKESVSEKVARKNYEKSRSKSDLLFWLSKWAKTEHE